MNSPSSSAFNIPEISLDFENQISDVEKLRILPHLLTPPSCEVSDLIARIRDTPSDCQLHAELSAYLFGRYTATIEYARKIQAEPCYDCLETTDALRKLQEASRAQPQLQRDIELILTRSFVRPSEYSAIAQPIDNSALQALSVQVAELREQCGGFLQESAAATIPAQDNIEEELRHLKREQVQAFNRAVELLSEKDQENYALAQELKQTTTKEQEYLQLIGEFETGEKRLKQEIQAYQESLDNAQPPTASVFQQYIANEIRSVPVPDIEKDFKNDKFAEPRTVSRPLIDILREAAYLLSKTLGSNDVRIEEAEFAPAANFSASESEILAEMNGIVSMCVLLRFQIQACLSAVETQPAAQEPEEEQPAVVQLNVAEETVGNIKFAIQTIIEHAFSMAYPPKAEQAQLGSYTVDELQRTVAEATPEGFYDSQFLQDLNELYEDIASEPSLTDVVSDLEVLENTFKSAARRSKIVQSEVIAVGESAFELERDLKERQQHIEHLHEQIEELKTLHNDELNFIQQLETQLKTKEGEATTLEAQVNAQKNDNLQLKVENERIPGLEEYCKQAKKDIEQQKFKLAEQEQQLENAQLEKDQLIQEGEKRKNDIEQLGAQLNASTDRIRELELDEKDLQKLKADTIAKNRELLMLARDLEEQLGESEKEVVELKETISREMPTLEENAQTYKTLMENAQNELMFVKEELRKIKEAEKDLRLAFEQSDARYQQLKTQEEELHSAANKAVNELKTVEEEADHFAELLAREQEKAQLLGENLDEVSALNIELEKQKTELTAEIEVLRRELSEEGGILTEVNQSYQRSKDAAERFEQLYVQQTERIEQTAQQTSAFEAKNSILQQEQQRALDMNEQLRAEIKSKQMLIEQMQAQMSGMTMNSMGSENQLKAMLKTNFEKEIQEIVETQRTQHQEQLQAVETDRNQLLEEFQQLRLENAQINKESKRLEKENAIYKEQLQQIQEIQTKLANKSKKLLKTTNILKQKALQFARSFERISTYCGNNAHYSATLQPEDAENAMSLTSLTQTASPDEVHASDAVRIPMVTEDFLKAVCDLLTAGKANKTLEDALTIARAETSQVEESVAEEQKKLEEATHEAERWHVKYEELKEQNEVMSSTIAMLSTRQPPLVPRQSGNSARESLGLEANTLPNKQPPRQNLTNAKNADERSQTSLNSPLDTAEALVRHLEAVEASDASEDREYEDEAVELIIKEQTAKKQEKQMQQPQSARTISESRSSSDHPGEAFKEQGQTNYSTQGAFAANVEASDSSEHEFVAMLEEYQPKKQESEPSNTDESVQNLTPTEKPTLRPVSVNLTADIATTPQIASEFEESVRNFQNRRGIEQTAREVSLLSDDERLMIQRLLEQ